MSAPGPIKLFFFSQRFDAYIIREGEGDTARWHGFPRRDLMRLIEYIRHKAILFPVEGAALEANLPESLTEYLRPLAPPAPLQSLNLDDLGL